MKTIQSFLLTAMLLPVVCFAQNEYDLTKLGQVFDYWSTANDAVFLGDHAFVSTGATGLRVLDISDLNNPVQVAVLDGSENWDNIVGMGTMLYALQRDQDLVAIDVSHPEFPVIRARSNVRHQFSITDIAMKPDDPTTIFCATIQGLVPIDASNPDSLIHLTDYRLFGNATSISISGNLAVITGEEELFLFDISNNDEPIFLSHYDPEFDVEFQSSAIKDNLIYTVCRNNQLLVTDFTDVNNPEDLGFLAPVDEINRIVFRDDTGFILARCTDRLALNNLFIYDFSAPLNPSLIGQGDSTYYGSNITLNGDYAALNNRNEGFRLVNISNFQSPVNLGDYGTIGGFDNIVIDRNLACIFGSAGHNDTHGFWVVDIQDPENPEIVGNYSDTIYIERFNYISILKDAYLYVAVNSVGLEIYDLIEPAQPVRIAGLAMNENFTSCYLRGEYLYMATSNTTVYFIDIQEPENPELTGSVVLPGGFGGRRQRSMTLAGSKLVTFISDSVSIWDITSDEAPRVLSTFLCDNIDRIFAREDRVIIEHATDNGNADILSVYDITNPERPIRRSSIFTPISVFSLDSDYNFLYGSNNYSLVAFKYSGIMNLQLVHTGRIDGGARSVTADGNLLYIVGDYSIGIYDFSEADFVSPTPDDQPATPPEDPTLLDVSPNPFNSTTTITFSLSPHAIAGGVGGVSLRIYDLSGRLVTDLVNSRLSAGTHKVVWDAGEIPAGVYLVKLTNGFQHISKKVVVIR